MLRRYGEMPAEEIFTRTVFGVVLIGSAFVGWGRWVALILGALFLLSAWQGICLTCRLYRWWASRHDEKRKTSGV